MCNCVKKKECRVVYIVIIVVCLMVSNEPSTSTISHTTITAIPPVTGEPSTSTIRHTLQLRNVHHLLVPKSCEWDRIGCGLGVDFNFREGLLRDGVQRTNDNKLEAVLNNWIETQCSEVSWDNLIQVLTQLEFIDIVRDVRSFLQKN